MLARRDWQSGLHLVSDHVQEFDRETHVGQSCEAKGERYATSLPNSKALEANALCTVADLQKTACFDNVDIAESATERAVKAAADLSADLVETANYGASKVRSSLSMPLCRPHRGFRSLVLQAFEEQQRIGAEVEKVLSLTKQLTEQNSEWSALIDSADQSLRVLGDFETYFEVLQQDLSKLTDSLQHLSQQKSAGSATQTAPS